MLNFIFGTLAMGLFIVGLYFLRFWRETRDRLFLIFACAFWVMAIERVVLAVTNPEQEYYPTIYLMRLAAFILIIIAIVDKNRARA